MTGEGKPAMTLDLAKGLVEWGWERKASRAAFKGPGLRTALPGGGESVGWAADTRQTRVTMHTERLLASVDHIVFVD